MDTDYGVKEHIHFFFIHALKKFRHAEWAGLPASRRQSSTGSTDPSPSKILKIVLPNCEHTKALFLFFALFSSGIPLYFLLFDPSFCYLLFPIYNADTDKLQVCSDNKGKSGVYCFTNLVNGKKYIGSSADLRRRFRQYLNFNYLERNKSMAICLALLKYGYSKFSFEIIEYCDPSVLLTREKYFFNLFSPEYNISLEPGSPMLGRKHSEETKVKMSA
jgi:hypothetical protein